MALLGVNTSTGITLNLYPGFKGSAAPVARETARGFDATLFRSREVKYKFWEIPLEFVTASHAAIVQSWWDSGTELLFFEDPDIWANSAWPVAIVNRTVPLDEWMKPYWGEYKEGTLLLEARSGY